MLTKHEYEQIIKKIDDLKEQVEQLTHEDIGSIQIKLPSYAKNDEVLCSCDDLVVALQWILDNKVKLAFGYCYEELEIYVNSKYTTKRVIMIYLDEEDSTSIKIQGIIKPRS